MSETRKLVAILAADIAGYSRLVGAAGIPGARFVALPGKNHVLLEQDPGLPRFFEELKDFLTDVS